MSKVILFAVVGIVANAVVASLAQAQAPARLRGTIVSLDGNVMTVKTAVGKDVRVQLADTTNITYPRRITMADIKEGDFIGTTALPGPDGRLVAREVHLFPPAQRGTGEGHNPWDLEPGSTMTNANVSKSAKASGGQELVLEYKGGSKTVVVPPNIPIVTMVPGDRSLLVPGAFVLLFGPAGSDGAINARVVQVTSKDGVKPPM
jgi:hypothetical protein